jgi:hypothetical protein
MSTEILGTFLQYGALGAVAVFGILWAMRKDREVTRQREQHQEEMRAVLERYVAKAESWSEKYYELTRELRDLVKALRSANGQT